MSVVPSSFIFQKRYFWLNVENSKMARNSDFASYCNNLLNDTSGLVHFDNLSPMEPLVYYDLKPVSETIKE